MRERSERVCLALLGGFECLHLGRSVSLPLGSQRLLALLALQKTGVHRAVASERLWPNSAPERAAANLRSALWRGRRLGDTVLIYCVGPRLSLTPTVRVDFQQIMDSHLNSTDPELLSGVPDHLVMVRELTLQLLPEWSEDWLVYERERWHAFRLHALEELAATLQVEERYSDALQTALEAIAIEPIRETAHRIVIRIHLAEGNHASAFRHYQDYRRLLQVELGVAPSVRMDQLVQPLLSS